LFSFSIFELNRIDFVILKERETEEKEREREKGKEAAMFVGE
jgi:hypothetical protein